MHSSIVDEFTGSAILGKNTNIELYHSNILNGASIHGTSPVHWV